MNFYTLIFNNTKHSKQWILYTLLSVFFCSLFIIAINFMVDPYNITKYNILNIKYKFARDDRTEKVNYFKTLNKFDNILIGSSRVYSMNPLQVSKVLGGTTYNFGVGTATVEDHLGIIKYLERENKLPKNIIIGIDFYTFNPNTPLNSYFLRNKELNFLSYKGYDAEYMSKLYSIDALRASIKTLKKHLFDKNERSRFDSLGWAGTYEDYSNKNMDTALIRVKKELKENLNRFYTNLTYGHIDKKRVQYYEKIRKFCKEKNINLYLFTTPLHPILLEILERNERTKNALEEFNTYLSTFQNFQNLYHDEELYHELKNFHGATHTTSIAGDLILKKVLTKVRYNETN